MTRSLEPAKLDCPFCGQQPVTDWQYAWGGSIVGKVSCSTADCIKPTAMAIIPPPHHSDAASAVNAIGLAVQRWNKRP